MLRLIHKINPLRDEIELPIIRLLFYVHQAKALVMDLLTTTDRKMLKKPSTL